MGVPNPAIFLRIDENKKVQKAQVVKEIVKTMIKESVSLSDLEEEIVSI